MSKNSSRTSDYKAIRLEVLEDAGYLCAYGCGREATQVDHVIPKVAGGTDDRENLVASCAECNNKKGANVLPPRGNWFNPKWLEHL